MRLGGIRGSTYRAGHDAVMVLIMKRHCMRSCHNLPTIKYKNPYRCTSHSIHRISQQRQNFCHPISPTSLISPSTSAGGTYPRGSAEDLNAKPTAFFHFRTSSTSAPLLLPSQTFHIVRYHRLLHNAIPNHLLLLSRPPCVVMQIKCSVRRSPYEHAALVFHRSQGLERTSLG